MVEQRNQRPTGRIIEFLRGLFGRTIVALVHTVLACNSLTVSGEEITPAAEEVGISYLENELIKVGADLRRGGSIGFLADVMRGENIVNIHDLGRWIGQSYYSGPQPFGDAHPGWKGWPWNPVSAGDVYGNFAKLLEFKNDGRLLYIKSTPKQWALNNVPAECTFETWIQLDGRMVQVRNRLTNQRPDTKQYQAMDQELPAVYTIGKLHRLMSYTGGRPFRGEALQEIPQQNTSQSKPQWTSFFATEHWAALVDDQDWGLGIIHPGVVRFLGGFYGQQTTGGSTDDPTGYVAPVRQEILDHNIVYEYRYYLVLDTLTNIRRAAVSLRPLSSLPDYRFSAGRNHWWCMNAEDAGTTVATGIRLKVDGDDPQFIGPETFWIADDVPTLYIRAAYRTRGANARLFWESTDRPGFLNEQSIGFQVIADAKMRTYELDLSRIAAYRGGIRRLRFDPVDAGQPGETVDIEVISSNKP